SAEAIRRTLLGDDVDDAGHRVAVLGIERSRDHLQLLNAFVLELDGRRAIEAVGDGYAIHQYDDLAAPPAANVHSAAAVRHAGLYVQHLAHLLNREPVDRLRGDAGLGTRDVFANAFQLGGHDDLFAL